MQFSNLFEQPLSGKLTTITPKIPNAEYKKFKVAKTASFSLAMRQAVCASCTVTMDKLPEYLCTLKRNGLSNKEIAAFLSEKTAMPITVNMIVPFTRDREVPLPPRGPGKQLDRFKPDYKITDDEAKELAALWKSQGRPVKLNLDGTIQKTQFNHYIRSIKKNKLHELDVIDKKKQEAFASEFATLNLTEEKMASIKERFAQGEISQEDYKKVILFKYEQDLLFMATRLFRDMTLDRSTNTYTPSPPFHQEIVDVLHSSNRVALAAPRGHSKSTLIGFFYILHQALFNKKKNIVIVSATEDLAIRFLRDIKTELEVNKQLIWLFGPQQSDKWSEKEILMLNGCRIYAKGRGGQLRGLKERGNRPDLIVCDDLEDSELVRSELRRMDLEDWFNGDVMPTLEPKIGQLVVVGTILHASSLLNRLLNQELYPDFTSKIYRAIKEDGTPLWPERFTIEFLEQTKASFISRGQLATFYMEYMNDPMPDDGATFKQSYFQFFNELPTPNTRELFIDLGGGGVKKSADDTAMVVLAIDESGIMYVEDYISTSMGTDTDVMINHIFKLTKQHGIRKVYIEKTQAANLLAASLDRKMKLTAQYLNVEYVVPTRGSGDKRGNMSDGKFQRIAQMEAPFKLGMIKIRPWMTKLIEQLLVFPRGQHDDLIDALSYGYLFGKKKNKSVAKQYRPRFSR